MSVKIIYFVHGTTTDNLEKKSTGLNPGVLSELGIKQSKELKENINLDEIDFVISSDLKRAVDSANYVFRGEKTILYDKRLRECNYGDLNGQDSKLVIDEEHIENKYPNGESMKDVENRLRDFCDFLLKNHDGKTIALVAHKAPQLALEVITKNITWEEALANDWRKTKNWQPGWIYEISGQEIYKDITIKELQKCIKKINHKNNNNKDCMFKLMEEMGELAEVVRKNIRMKDGESIKGTIEEELQDVLYYIICMANINDIDLQKCIYLKEEINCKKYNRENMFEL